MNREMIQTVSLGWHINLNQTRYWSGREPWSSCFSSTSPWVDSRSSSTWPVHYPQSHVIQFDFARDQAHPVTTSTLVMACFCSPLTDRFAITLTDMYVCTLCSTFRGRFCWGLKVHHSEYLSPQFDPVLLIHIGPEPQKILAHGHQLPGFSNDLC
jgi:hypothetical protein